MTKAKPFAPAAESGPAHSCCSARPVSETDDSAELKDPVCGMAVTPQTGFHHEHSGSTWYFCSARCQSKFSDAPENI